MEKEKLREKALKMYAELMVQKIKEVDNCSYYYGDP